MTQNEAIIKAHKDEMIKIKTVIKELSKSMSLSHADKLAIKNYIRQYSTFSAEDIIAHFKS